MLKPNRRIVFLWVVLGMCLAFGSPRAGDSAPEGQIVEMHVSAYPYNWNGACPVSVNFSGFIRVDGPLTVTYGIDRSDGAKGMGRQTFKFTSAGKRDIHFSWRLGKPGENFHGWAQIGSGDMSSNQAEFDLHCK